MTEKQRLYTSSDFLKRNGSHAERVNFTILDEMPPPPSKDIVGEIYDRREDIDRKDIEIILPDDVQDIDRCLKGVYVGVRRPVFSSDSKYYLSMYLPFREHVKPTFYVGEVCLDVNYFLADIYVQSLRLFPRSYQKRILRCCA
jgi:hypothetical protein